MNFKHFFDKYQLSKKLWEMTGLTSCCRQAAFRAQRGSLRQHAHVIGYKLTTMQISTDMAKMKLISKKGFDFFCNDDFVFFIDRDENDKDMFFKTDLDKLIEISIDEYTNNKFGKSWRTLNSAYTECIHLDNGEYLTCIFHNSTIIRHDIDGNKIKEYNIGHFQTGFDTTYSIALDKNGNLWIAQPTSHFVGQFSLETEEELFRIGGDFENPDTFDHPEQVRAFDEFVFVCDMGNKRICKININTKELTEYKKFETPIFEYGQFKTKEIVKLITGLYEL